MKSASPILNSSSPMYMQLAQKLREDIRVGLYPVGSRIPSEKELCEQYGISRVTVRKTLDLLVGEDLLTRRQGSGTFVAGSKLARNLHMVTSFTEVARSQGKTVENKIIHVSLVNADADDCSQLQIPAGSKVIETCRVRYIDGEAMMLEYNHFPDRFLYLMEEDLTCSLYETLQNHCTIPVKAVHDLSISYSSGHISKMMDIPDKSALLNMFEVVYDEYDVPIHTSRQYIRGDRIIFRI